MLASIHVFTFKAGLLARLAHDLQLSVSQFELTLHAGRISAQCDARSLRVDGVVTERGLDPAALSEHDKRTIADTIANEILSAERFAQVVLEGTIEAGSSAAAFQIHGRLRLRGQERPLNLSLAVAQDCVRGQFELTPSQFGIAPYRAMAGAIRLQDRLVVNAELQLAGQSASALLGAAEPVRFAPAPVAP